jgi:hypothetical protein
MGHSPEWGENAGFEPNVAPGATQKDIPKVEAALYAKALTSPRRTPGRRVSSTMHAQGEA